ncbi:hybrid sensor histidine kinase/response regulator [Shewanella surugensis]|uniref:histidine kinase n=1 Tax=Shewanella surugensis TaxID=212020 RepID=A0ABT0LJM2_9GAMM|nr:CHASE3 domain-containing protein [Shewanella surugensis]MCL1127909.1 CHASE3 domain-containing protein [Shewanella surugensis]
MLHFSFKEKIYFGALLPILLLFIISIVIYLSIQRQTETTKWVEHTQEVIARSSNLTKLLLDMETGERGFLITGKLEFLEPYDATKKVWDKKLASLKNLVSDNQEQVARIDKIAILQIKWLKEAAEIEIAARNQVKVSNEVSISDVQALIEKGTGKNIIDQIRMINNQFVDIEQKLLSKRRQSQEHASQQTVLIVIIGTIIAMLFAIIFAYYLSRNIINTLIILIDGAKEIEQGNFDNHITIESEDEFYLLANAFNEMSQSLKKSINAMENAMKSKSDFLTNMSHEIRTPISGILGMLALLEDTKLDNEQHEYLSTIQLCADGLLVVINDVLDISKLEEGPLNLDNTPFNLRQTVSECCYLLDVQASNKGLDITIDLDATLPDTLMGDKLRIRQILLNIMNNAIKFTDKGTIDLVIKVISRSADEIKVTFIITDKGIGISQANQSKLFSQVDNSIARKYGGTGLGLIICTQLIKQMEGDIIVKSELGKGTSVIFTLPMLKAKSDDKGLLSSHSFINSSTLKLSKRYPLTILLAEDNKINQVIAKKVFQQLGYDVDLAVDGIEAVKSANEKTYDIIYMDMQMPNMDGITATEIIIEQQAAKPPYIVAMTANVLPQDRQRCFDAGMQDFVGKPINVDYIITTIERYIESIQLDT